MRSDYGRCGLLNNLQPHSSKTDGPQLPYAAVMATGAASELAATARASALRLPLFWLAVAMAVAIPIWHLVAHGKVRSRIADLPHSRFGWFTIPIGLSVIGNGFAAFSGPTLHFATILTICLAWVTTVLVMRETVLPLSRQWPGVSKFEGSWFLAPAALLADAIGLASLETHSALSGGPPLAWLAVVIAGLGALTYLVAIALGSARLLRVGLGRRGTASWWIAAGCGGLSAAALGRVSSVVPAGFGIATSHAFGLLALFFWIIGSAALIPVVVASLGFLFRLRHLEGKPPWPPTFSTGVYALGAAQVGRLLTARTVDTVSNVTAVATLTIWVVTVLAHTPRLFKKSRLQSLTPPERGTWKAP